MLASFDAAVGTLWWSILMVCVGFGAGMFLRPMIMKILNRGK